MEELLSVCLVACWCCLIWGFQQGMFGFIDKYYCSAFCISSQKPQPQSDVSKALSSASPRSTISWKKNRDWWAASLPRMVWSIKILCLSKFCVNFITISPWVSPAWSNWVYSVLPLVFPHVRTLFRALWCTKQDCAKGLKGAEKLTNNHQSCDEFLRHNRK